MNICPTEKRAFVIIPRKFKYIIADILVKKNVCWGNPAFLKEKFFTRCELQGTSCKFLEKMREDKIAALSSKSRNDRGIKTINILLTNSY